MKTISAGEAPIAQATASLASSTARRASRPGPWTDDGFAASEESHGNIASSASGASGVVAWWSA